MSAVQFWNALAESRHVDEYGQQYLLNFKCVKRLAAQSSEARGSF